MKVAGVDPGLSGGCAVIATGDDRTLPFVVDVIDVPTRGEGPKRRVDVPQLAQWFRTHQPDVCFVERGQAFPSQGLSSTFIFGRACGAIEACAILAHVPLHVIEASAWKQAFTLRGGDKEASRRAVARVFPDAERFLERKKDHHRAEALAIAMFGSDLIADGFQWDNLRESAA